MTDQANTSDHDGSDGARDGQPPRIHTLPDAGRPDQPAPSEQPYFVPTEHQAAWSNAHYYAGGQYQQNAPYQPSGQYAAAPYAGNPYAAGAPYPQQYGQQQYGSQQYGQQQYGQYPPPYGPGYQQAAPYPPYGEGHWTPPAAKPKRGHGAVYGMVAAGVAAALAVGGVALAVDNSHSNTQATAATTPNQGSQNGNSFGFGNGGSGSSGSSGNGFGFGSGSNGSDGSSGSSGSGSSGSGSSGSSSTGTTGTANATQSVGVVDINTVLDYGQGKAAGTGIVLTSNGEILTNNHVVESSTSISVTVVSTGKTYTARVVGTDPTDDVAVIQLQNASGLATAKLGDSSKVATGDSVTAIGNAGGTGGTPSAATGSVTALNRSITASDEDGSNSERLTGLIEVNANIQAGDSGGPLYENDGGTVIGMDTAASSSGSRFGNTTSTTGFAIPIATATAIAQQIVSGTESSKIELGYPAFFGVQLSASSSQSGAGSQSGTGATISGVVSGSGAEKAGLAAGDTITAVDGKAIASADALSSVTASHKPGDQVSVTYTDSDGQKHTATVTLGEGPVK